MLDLSINRAKVSRFSEERRTPGRGIWPAAHSGAPGTSYRFVVEACNSTSVADSSPATLTTLAAARPLDQVTIWEGIS